MLSIFVKSIVSIGRKIDHIDILEIDRINPVNDGAIDISNLNQRPRCISVFAVDLDMGSGGGDYQYLTIKQINSRPEIYDR